MNKNGLLIVLVGPTAVGKTSVAIELAKKYNAEIISADSRQFYKEIPLGTAAPTKDELADVKHHFVANKSIQDYYNVSIFEQEVLQLLEKKFKERNLMIMVGGSGMYIDAVCKGIDDLPDADEELRSQLNDFFNENGIIALQEKLKQLDPVYYNVVDLKNPKRLLRAIEVSIQTGIPYSSQRIGNYIERSFNILKIGLEMPREQLNQRIERRLSSMIDEGWLNEAIAVQSLRNNNALNTVGYKELYKYLDKEWEFDFALEKIKVNTRRYAKRQMTWFKRDSEINWHLPSEIKKMSDLIDTRLSLI